MTLAPSARLGRAARAATASLALVSAGACGDGPVTPLPEEGPALALEYSIGGYGGDQRSIKLKGGTIEHVSIPWDYRPGMAIDTVRRVPTADEWRWFWAEAKAAGVGRWRGTHVARNIADGTGWSLEIVVDGRRIQASGSNMYPDRKGEWHAPDQTPDFLRFSAAAFMLAGFVFN